MQEPEETRHVASAGREGSWPRLDWREHSVTPGALNFQSVNNVAPGADIALSSAVRRFSGQAPGSRSDCALPAIAAWYVGHYGKLHFASPLIVSGV